MRKFFLLVLCLCLLSGCAPTPAPAPETVPAPEPKINISPNTSTLNAQDGTTIYRQTSPTIVVSLADQAAADSINCDIPEILRQWTSDLLDLQNYAKNEYEPGNSWDLIFCDIKAQSMRLDERVLSVYLECNKYTGGNHPTLAVDGATYDCKTGQRLTLADLMAEGHAPWELSSLVNTALTPSKDRLYDDYEALVSNAFSEERFPCWYLSDDGLCFAFAPYAIGSFASGIIIAEISYEKLGELLRPEYL